ncbi:ABC transporter permease [Phycicoccus endophyticus]|uniref:ABC transporter permease n=1 Tax=Phycicoccus endophyticus TaxID=1690220 RepID=A0A7G9R5L3_9MICO|nr:ABC transporter permease [Phycicoccus endophyticus]NHI19805.1 ABC transporter permease [Phycicoccus endophyticus]QNN50888.1 ABC transporter permease [Phycicoccus endophyticus]
MVRHRYLLPVFTAVQALFAVAIVYGLALLLPEVDAAAARRLSSGAWTLGVIAVGCVLAPRVVTASKQEGLLEYQRTLPVPPSALLLADMTVWGVAALPGIAVGVAASVTRFDLDLSPGPSLVGALVLVLVAATGIGYAIAYWLPPEAAGLATQVVMIGGLLFSPITFSPDRLPAWAATVHEYLPFAPMGNLVREKAFGGAVDVRDLVVVAVWGTAGVLAALGYLVRRR